jgi:hypothetical protein
VDPEQFRNWFRAIEFFERRDGWYFLSPHGLAVGPWESEGTAIAQASRLAKIVKRMNDAEVRRTIVEFMLTGGNSV